MTPQTPTFTLDESQIADHFERGREAGSRKAGGLRRDREDGLD